MAVSAAVHFKMLVTETLALGDLASGSATAQHDLTQTTNFTLDADSTPPITQVWSDSFDMVTAAATLDLQDLARTNQANLDLAPLKIQGMLAGVPATNTDSVNISVGASNGYDIFNSAAGEMDLGTTAGSGAGMVMFYQPEALQVVGTTNKDIDFASGVDPNATIEVILIAGAVANMALSLGSIIIELKAKTQAFVNNIKKAQGALGRWAVAASKNVLIGNVLAQTFVKLAHAVPTLVRSTMKMVDQLGKAADAFGLTTKELAGYRLAGERAGITVSELDRAFVRMNQRIGDHIFKTSEAMKTLNQLGVSYEDLELMSTGERFKTLLNVIDKLPNSLARASAANAFFGRTGIKVVKMAELGSSTLDKFLDVAERSGVAPTRKMVAQVEDANDAILQMNKSLKGFVIGEIIKLAPAIEAAANAITVLVEKLKTLGSFRPPAWFNKILAWYDAVKPGKRDLQKRANEHLYRWIKGQAAEMFPGEMGPRQEERVTTIDPEAIQKRIEDINAFRKKWSFAWNHPIETVTHKYNNFMAGVNRGIDKIRNSLRDALKRDVIAILDVVQEITKGMNDAFNMSIGATTASQATSAFSINAGPAKSLKDIALTVKKQLEADKRSNKSLDELIALLPKGVI